MAQKFDLHNDKTYDALSKRTHSSMRYEQLVLAPALSYMHGATAYSKSGMDRLMDKKDPPTVDYSCHVATWEERRKEIKGWMTARRADLKLILELVGDYSAELVASRLLVTGAVGDVTIGSKGRSSAHVVGGSAVSTYDVSQRATLENMEACGTGENERRCYEEECKRVGCEITLLTRRAQLVAVPSKGADILGEPEQRLPLCVFASGMVEKVRKGKVKYRAMSDYSRPRGVGVNARIEL
ncbi:hypothetical protein CYMTET_21870 [Cymbomonas tetramitiformis]|uniref:Uncharacterized protein n=1 Tax=Cymbomonas tetramitiformis TaxID=36881 RepID=A0AAE0L2Q7_9CHLO|nr:hypothetical protein CYMTET_21870 [Cymbomonas tetramitiformis]